MKIIALLEVTPFDGSDPILCIRIEAQHGLFDLPITEEQLTILLNNMGGSPEAEVPPPSPKRVQEDEDSSEEVTHYAPSPVKRPTQNTSQFKMGYSPDYEDDDL